MVSHDPYEILGVTRSASQAKITDAYRELLDKYYLKDVRQFKLIVQAYLMLSGMEYEDNPPVQPPRSIVTIIRTSPTTWTRSEYLKIVCVAGGSILLGFVAYKTFQQLGRALSKRAFNGAALMETAESTASVSPLSIVGPSGTVLNPPSSTSSSIASSASSIAGSTLGAASKALKWTAGSAGSVWQWTARKVSEQPTDSSSNSSNSPSANSVANSSLSAMSKVWKWTTGSADASSSSTGSAVSTPLGAFSKAWQWTTDKISSQAADSASSVESSSAGTMSKIWKWATGQG